MFLVYKLTSPSQKSYIGWCSVSLAKRISNHVWLAKNTNTKRKICSALRKYPISLWEKQILFETNDKELSLLKEKEFIQQFNAIKDGYNHSLGGEFGGLGCVSIKSNLGKKFSQETCLLMSKAHKGKHFTEKHKLNMIDSISKLWKIITPDGQAFTIKNLHKYCKKNNLDTGCMSKVAKGILPHHKLYKAAKVNETT